MSQSTLDHVYSYEEEFDAESTYKPPPEKSIEQILEADKEDESLRKYKETLLGEAKTGGVVVGKLIICIISICFTLFYSWMKEIIF